jgi:hypothetical protein
MEICTTVCVKLSLIKRTYVKERVKEICTTVCVKLSLIELISRNGRIDHDEVTDDQWTG